MDERVESRDTHRQKLQAQRLMQLKELPPGALESLVEHMRVHARLPRLQMHFHRHGHEFGAASAEEYERRFRKHVTRDDLQRFTFIRSETGDVRWYLVESATGTIAVYNATHTRYWSFFRNRNVPKLLNGFRDYWVEVDQYDDDWQIRPW